MNIIACLLEPFLDRGNCCKNTSVVSELNYFSSWSCISHVSGLTEKSVMHLFSVVLIALQSQL